MATALIGSACDGGGRETPMVEPPGWEEPQPDRPRYPVMMSMNRECQQGTRSLWIEVEGRASRLKWFAIRENAIELTVVETHEPDLETEDWERQHWIMSLDVVEDGPLDSTYQTGLPCSDEPDLTFMVFAFDEWRTNVIRDCAIFGADAESWQQARDLDSCLIWN